MKNAILVSILTVVLVVSASAVFAGAPLNGTWKSTNGDFDEGTMTANGYFLFYNEPGTGFFRMYARSFAGGVFTDDWTIGCVWLSYSTLIVPRVGPTGNETWQFVYDGSSGYATLGGPGNPWNGGDAVYNGIIDSFVEFRTVQFVNNVVVGAVSDYAISAHIQGYPESCVSWAIGNGVLRGGGGDTQYGPAFAYPPLQDGIVFSNYPGFPDWGLGSECSLLSLPTQGGAGFWGDVRDLTLSITGCTVKTEPSTWGAVKAIYRN